MKRIVAAAVAVALVGLLGGCAARAGDGDLVDDWSMLPKAAVPEPVEGSCWNSSATGAFSDSVYLDKGACDASHTFETMSVGHFTGEVAAAEMPPEGAALRDAWAECDKVAGDYLGGDWQSGRVFVTVSLPTKAEWHGGGRFYSCNAAALKTEAGEFMQGKDLLKNGLAGDGQLKLSCGNQVGASGGGWDDITSAACTAPHNVEYAGWVTTPTEAYPADNKAFDAAYSKTCEAKVQAFTGMSHSFYASQQALSFGYWLTADKNEWAAGNHSARCYLVIDGKTISRSLKGAGNVAV